MDGHFEELNMSETQTQWFCRGLVDLANADGMHETELEVIEEFCRSSQLKDVNIDALGAMGFDASHAAAAIPLVALGRALSLAASW